MRSLFSWFVVSKVLSAFASSVQSSAKRNGVVSKFDTKSFMKIMKRRGPRELPCGTPAFSGRGDDLWPSTTVTVSFFFQI